MVGIQPRMRRFRVEDELAPADVFLALNAHGAHGCAPRLKIGLAIEVLGLEVAVAVWVRRVCYTPALAQNRSMQSSARKTTYRVSPNVLFVDSNVATVGRVIHMNCAASRIFRWFRTRVNCPVSYEGELSLSRMVYRSGTWSFLEVQQPSPLRIQ